MIGLDSVAVSLAGAHVMFVGFREQLTVEHASGDPCLMYMDDLPGPL